MYSSTTSRLIFFFELYAFIILTSTLFIGTFRDTAITCKYQFANTDTICRTSFIVVRHPHVSLSSFRLGGSHPMYMESVTISYRENRHLRILTSVHLINSFIICLDNKETNFWWERLQNNNRLFIYFSFYLTNNYFPKGRTYRSTNNSVIFRSKFKILFCFCP